jgi:hypothetical protein
MKGWMRHGRIRISVPRWRAQDAFGLAVCFLAWADAEWIGCSSREHECIVPLDVNDLTCLESEAPQERLFSPLHLLYMRLLDDGDDGGGEEERDRDCSNARGNRKGVSGKVGLGIVGVGLDPPEEGEEEADEREDDRSVHSDSTTGSSRPTLMRTRRGGLGFHVREAALGGIGLETSSYPSSSSSSSLSSSSSSEEITEWTGLRDEWRGVLSYEGLNTLVGVWP